MPLAVAAPRDENSAIRELLGRVFEGAEFRDTAGALEFTFVIPLFGERHEEALFAFLILQCHHCLLNVVVVCFELLFEIGGLVVKAHEGESNALEFALALDAAAVLGTDVNCDRVKEVLVMIMACETVAFFESKDVFEGCALEFRV